MDEDRFRDRWLEFRRSRFLLTSPMLSYWFEGDQIKPAFLKRAVSTTLLFNLITLFDEATLAKMPEGSRHGTLETRISWLNSVGAVEDFEGVTRMRELFEESVENRSWRAARDFPACYTIVEKQLLAWGFIDPWPITMQMRRKHKLGRYITKPTAEEESIQYRLSINFRTEEGEVSRSGGGPPIDDLDERLTHYEGLAAGRPAWMDGLEQRIAKEPTADRPLAACRPEAALLTQTLQTELAYLEDLAATSAPNQAVRAQAMIDILLPLLPRIAAVNKELAAEG